MELRGRVLNCCGGCCCGVVYGTAMEGVVWNSVGEGMELAELHTYMICLWEVKLLGRVLIVELL